LAGPVVEGDRQKTERANSGRAVRLWIRLDRERIEKIEALAKSLGSSLPRMLLGLVYLTFNRLYGLNDIVIGFPLHHRLSPEAKRTIALFTQAMPFRVALDRQTSFADAVNSIDQWMAQDREHSRFPTGTLASSLGLTRQ